ncbi:hypothetical protein RUX19_29280, partial [Klebsiella oxytoca]|nr:hypothetical protein [Klebsiella oxytoca]
MSNRRIENPITSTNKHGETIQSHPAFGLVKTSRVHTTGIRLFDSELKHQEYIEIGVYEAEMTMDREHPTLDWPLYFQTLFIALPITGSPPQIFPW